MQPFGCEEWLRRFVPGLGTFPLRLFSVAVGLGQLLYPLLLFWGQQPFSVQVAVVGALAAQVFGEPYPDEMSRAPVANLIIQIAETACQQDPPGTLVVGASPFVEGIWQHAGPLGDSSGKTLEGLVTQTVFCHRALAVGAYSPPFWYLFEVDHDNNELFAGKDTHYLNGCQTFSCVFSVFGLLHTPNKFAYTK